MKLTVLGSGTAAPRLDRNMSGYLIEADKKKILFDSGPGTIRQLLKLKINLLDIDHIFYSHMHNDHISDLPAIIWSNNYGTFRKKPLNIYGPRGFMKYFRILMKVMKPNDLIFKINVKEMKKDPIKIGNLEFKAIKVKHFGSSQALKIENKGKSLVYSGDSAFCKPLIEICNKADLIILDCAFPDNKPNKLHLSPSQCGQIASKSKAKKLLLTHFYPEADLVDVVKQAKKTFKGPILKAKDFLTLKV